MRAAFGAVGCSPDAGSGDTLIGFSFLLAKAGCSAMTLRF